MLLCGFVFSFQTGHSLTSMGCASDNDCTVKLSIHRPDEPPGGIRIIRSFISVAFIKIVCIFLGIDGIDRAQVIGVLAAH
jgi:hypothetical protein